LRRRQGLMPDERPVGRWRTGLNSKMKNTTRCAGRASLASSIALAILSSPAIGQDATVQYLANEGVMVTSGDSKVLFDPLFDNGFRTYQMVPDDVRSAIFAGEAPYDGVDAIFVSHFHGDHFSAADVLRLMRAQPSIHLYAPAQATAAIREIATADDQAVLDRMTGLDLEYGDAPVHISAGELSIDAAFVPHSGWPTRRTEVQNIAFRVRFADDGTVLHLGDADARSIHFEADADYWEQQAIDVALPPYWFFESEDGVEILEFRLDVMHAIGIHVPDELVDPGRRSEALLGEDLFTRPGEGRRF